LSLKVSRLSYGDGQNVALRQYPNDKEISRYHSARIGNGLQPLRDQAMRRGRQPAAHQHAEPMTMTTAARPLPRRTE
jgi:hypothetical protein